MNIIKKILNKKIEIHEENNRIIITIKEQLTLEEYIKTIKKTKYSYLLNTIDLKHLLDNTFISPKKIIFTKINNITYIISVTKEKTKIIKQTQEEKILEETLEIDKINNTYQISRLIYSLDGSTQDVKTYNKDQSKNHKLFLLPKPEAIIIAQNILENLLLQQIDTSININELYKVFNLIPNKDYYQLITNGNITLSWKDKYGSTDINKKIRATLNIILNETQEKVGEITFNFIYNKKNSFIGNTGYHIDDEFQNKHYATEALSLLKELLKRNHYEGSKELFISTDISNIRSQKVAINNDGELYYEGEIPKNDPLSRHSGITHIKMYRIKI